VSIRGTPLTQGNPYPEPPFVPYRHPEGYDPAAEPAPRTAAAVNSQKAARARRFARYAALRDGGKTKAEAAAEMRLGRSTAGTYHREYEQQRGEGTA
jgi:hypothetical protein